MSNLSSLTHPLVVPSSNTKDDTLKNVSNQTVNESLASMLGERNTMGGHTIHQESGYQFSLKYIFCVQQKKETHTGLKQHNGK